MAQLRAIVLMSTAAALVACQAAAERRASAPAASVRVEPVEDWRQIALPEHSGITEDLPPLFERLAAGARRGAADRDLLDAALLLPAATPAPGAYRCRLVRLPAPAPATGRRERAGGRPSFCFVGADADRLSLTLETPARRLGGYLWPSAEPRRLVFLGAGFAAPARSAPAYSAVPGVNTAGLLERIGDFRYRLVTRGPSPGTVDVWEMSAAPPDR
ncbi:MAG TPA: DUF4893 domain-containing protein [Allosphingosinicella sp.]|jgi:hypothetical protein